MRLDEEEGKHGAFPSLKKWPPLHPADDGVFPFGPPAGWQTETHWPSPDERNSF
jgi:hypothetical protein